MLYLMGMPAPRRMSGQLYQKIAMDEARRLESGFDVEELGVGLVRFDRQVTMDLFESWAVHLDQMDPSILLGSKGRSLALKVNVCSPASLLKWSNSTTLKSGLMEPMS